MVPSAIIPALGWAGTIAEAALGAFSCLANEHGGQPPLTPVPAAGLRTEHDGKLWGKDPAGLLCFAAAGGAFLLHGNGA